MITGLAIAGSCLVLGFGAGRLCRHGLPAVRRRARERQLKNPLEIPVKARKTDHIILVDKSQAIQLWIESSTQTAEVVRDRLKWFAGASTVPLAVTASLLAVTKEPNVNLVAALLLFILSLYISLLPLAGLAEQMHRSTRLMGQSIVDVPHEASVGIALPYVWPRARYRVMEIIALVLFAAGLLFLASGVLK